MRMKTKLLIFPIFNEWSIADDRWDQNTDICWIEEPFSKDIEILISDEYNVNEVSHEETESDRESDKF